MAQRTANDVLDESFLEVRAKLLEVAASLDRIDRAADSQGAATGAAAERRATLNEAVRILMDDRPQRAEKLQHLFSRDYQSDWREAMKL